METGLRRRGKKKIEKVVDKYLALSSFVRVCVHKKKFPLVLEKKKREIPPLNYSIPHLGLRVTRFWLFYVHTYVCINELKKRQNQATLP